MKHRDENLPALLGQGGEIIDPMDRKGAIGELSSEERKRYFIELRETARQVSREVVSIEDTFSVGRGRGMDQGGVQSLATYFNLETWTDEPTVVWQENRPFLEAHRNNQDLPPNVAPVPEHVSVRVVGHVRTPWGHHVMRAGSCSSRGKHFWHSRNGQLANYNTKKYREGAEHIAIGIAETRAIARAVKAALMIGGETWEDEQFDRERYEERKRQKEEGSALENAVREWDKLVKRLGVTPEEEEAFAAALKDLPDERDEWGPDEYAFAYRAAEANGRSIFRTALQKLEARERVPEDDGRAPPEDEESNERADADPEAVDERAETEASEPNEPAETDVADPEQETVDPKVAKKKRSLIESIDGVCKLMGEDRTRAEQYAGDRWGDGTPMPLEDLSVEDLEQVDRAMIEELSEGG